MKTGHYSLKTLLNMFSYIMFNVMAVASIRTIPHIALHGTFTLYAYIIIAIVFFIPLNLVIAELGSTWSGEGGFYFWITYGFTPRIGFIITFLHWFISHFWYILILAFGAFCFAFIIMPDLNSAYELASNKIYLALFMISVFCLMSYLNCKGISVSSKFCTLGVLAGILIPSIFLTVVTCYYLISGDISINMATFNYRFYHLSYNETFKITLIIIVTFLGTEIIAVHSRYLQNYKDKFAKIIFISTIIVITIFIINILSIIVLIPLMNFSALKPDMIIYFDFIFSRAGSGIVYRILAFCFLLGALGNISIWIISPCKSFLIAGIMEDLPQWIIKTNKHGLPVKIIIIQCIIVAFHCLALAIQQSIELVYLTFSSLCLISFLFIYIIMFIAAIKLRYKYPDKHRPFKIPFKNYGIWIISGCGIVVSSVFLAAGLIFPLRLSLKAHPFLFLVFLIIGFLIVLAIPLILYNKQFRILIFEKSDYKKNKKITLVLSLASTGLFCYFIKSLCNIVLARTLSTNEYGDFSLYFRMITVISIILILGTNNSAKKYLSKYLAISDIKSIYEFTAWNIKIITKIFKYYILLLVILFLIMPFINSSAYYFTVFFLSIAPVTALSLFFSGYILSNKWPLLYYFFNKIALYIIFLLLVGVGILYFQINIHMTQVVVYLLFTYLIMVFLEYFIIIKLFKEHRISFSYKILKRIKYDLNNGRIWMIDSLRLISNQLIYNLIWTIGFFILKIFDDTEHNSVAFYAAILVISNILFLVPSSITPIVTPKINYLATQKNYLVLQKYINTINLINILLLSILFGCMIIFSQQLLSFFGGKYYSANIPFIIISISYYIAAIFIPAGKILTYTDTDIQLKISILELCIVIILGVTGVILYSLPWLSIAMMVSILIKSILTFTSIKRKIPIKPLSLF
ncbi:MAG TPA: amino acid permease [Victivallales bacterium]|nr:amino acid permease [Victivallales bacterium]